MQSYRLSIIGFFFFWTLSHNAQIPKYYSQLDLSGKEEPLFLQLADLTMDNHTVFIPYTSSSTDTWDILRTSDILYYKQSIINQSNDILLIYGYDDNDNEFISDRTRNSFDLCDTFSCNGKWNREHIFAKSLANPWLETNFPGPGTDLHNLRAADSQKNTQRSNRLFIDDSGVDSRIINGDYFYPGDEWKGDVARIIMYMYLRYPSQCEAVNSATGPVTYAENNDMPDVFLEWNAEDPVSDFELSRNDIIQSYQGNRNPFIDNPYLATLIWGGPLANDSWDINKKTYYQNIEVYPVVCEEVLFLKNHTDDEPLSYTIKNNYGELIQSGETYNSIPIRIDSQGAYVLTLGEGEFKKSTTIFVQ